MLKRFEVHGLPRQDGPISAHLNSDLNIITGRNGSGKTTLLKLLWYIVSGNIEHAIREVPFSKVVVETDEYTISISRISSDQSRIEVTTDSAKLIFQDGYDDDADSFTDAESEANDFVKDFGSSVFFPTFRRIEGGFSLISSPPLSSIRQASRNRSDVEEALVALSRRLTVAKHTFVSAISTVDIVTLLMRHYTEMSEQSNNLQKEMSQRVIDQIKNYKKDSNIEAHEVSKADQVIDAIRSMIEMTDEKRAEILSPLDAVRSVVENLFRHSGIKLGSRLSFGDAATAVSSDMLSAGEKQMLSFICYNAFYNNSVIFIDEPELSLHVDWQRQLFPTLQGQGTSNQFIIATHSPFIYSKYSDKEIAMSVDRGDSGLDID